MLIDNLGRKIAIASALSILNVAIATVATKAADENYQCPADSNVCKYLVNTGETAKVSGGGGHTADKSAQIYAPKGMFLANLSATIVSQHGIRPNCAVESTQGANTVTVQGIDVTVYAGAVVRAHSETGSGLQREGETAHMQCMFSAKVVPLPK